MVVEMDNFAAELASEFEHRYVDHSARVSNFGDEENTSFIERWTLDVGR